MAIKKSELYSSLWKSCDELRGGMDASQYKDYVLVLLFVKYVSDKAASQRGYLLDVPKGGSFADMAMLKGDKEIGDKMNKIIAKLSEANDLRGVIDVADFNDADKLGKGKEMVDRLSNLVAIFDSPNLDFSSNRAEGDDLLGDAYEYLMRHFATESGKSKGQFYTPAEVSRVMAKVVGVGSAKNASQTIHDPTCGSGSLLLKAHDEAKSTAGLDLALYGQEMDNATSALARMNMILHDCPTAEIWQDNVLSSPHFKSPDGALKTFDFVVANPPFSFKAWGNGFNPTEDGFNRFEFGVPPAKNGDLAFLLHILTCLKSTGKAAVNLPHGVLFRGGAEAAIRREIVKRGYIKGIIGLPANLFYGTGIPACIVVLDKENAHARKGIFMIDASKGFIKDGNKNRLRAQDLHRIVDTFTRQLEVPRYARMVPLSEITDAKNDYNLNLPRYIDSTEPEDIQDIDAHLRGGIPNRDLDALDRYWQVLPSVRALLFEPAEREGYSQLRGDKGQLTGDSEQLTAKSGQLTANGAAPLSTVNYPLSTAHYRLSIKQHAEFIAFNRSVTALFAKWKRTNTPRLKQLGVDKGQLTGNSEQLTANGAALLSTVNSPLPSINSPLSIVPKALIETLAEDLLETFRQAHLLDPYDVYQHLMDYWDEAMQDDVYLIVQEGWKAVLDGKPNTDLIPPPLIIARYFAKEQAAIEQLEADRDTITRQLEELDEEHGGEEGLLAEAKTDKGKLTVKSVKDRLRQLKVDSGQLRVDKGQWTREEDEAQEAEVLRQYLTSIEQESEASKKVKDAQKALDAKVAAKYRQLSVDEIKTLVVNDKWLTALAAAVQSELDRVSQALTGRIRELADRYTVPLPKLTAEVECLAARVDEHLKEMGFTVDS